MLCVPCWTHDVQAGLRFPAHGVDVGKGVGRGHLAERIGVVDDGREEIDRLHERQLVAHFVDAGVVALIETDEKGGIALHGNTV